MWALVGVEREETGDNDDKKVIYHNNGGQKMKKRTQLRLIEWFRKLIQSYGAI